MTETRRKWFNIDAQLVWLKLLNLSLWGGTAFVRPYLVNFLYALGLTTHETAVIVGAVPLVGLGTGSAIGVVADRLKAHRRLLVVCLGVWVAGFELMAVINPRQVALGNVTTAEKAQTMDRIDHFTDSVFWKALFCYLAIEVRSLLCF